MDLLIEKTVTLSIAGTRRRRGWCSVLHDISCSVMRGMRLTSPVPINLLPDLNIYFLARSSTPATACPAVLTTSDSPSRLAQDRVTSSRDPALCRRIEDAALFICACCFTMEDSAIKISSAADEWLQQFSEEKVQRKESVKLR